jgi:hypothetical protein
MSSNDAKLPQLPGTRQPYVDATMTDLALALNRYQAGDMKPHEVDDLFQALLDTGLVYHLEDTYQRTAGDLVDQGRCILPKSEE